MVSLVQLVEHQIVVLGVVGSSPTGYPTKKTAASSDGLFWYNLVKILEPLRTSTKNPG